MFVSLDVFQGFSESETWFSLLDNGTNYCNLYNVIYGTFSTNVVVTDFIIGSLFTGLLEDTKPISTDIVDHEPTHMLSFSTSIFSSAVLLWVFVAA